MKYVLLLALMDNANTGVLLKRKIFVELDNKPLVTCKHGSILIIHSDSPFNVAVTAESLEGKASYTMDGEPKKRACVPIVFKKTFSKKLSDSFFVIEDDDAVKDMILENLSPKITVGLVSLCENNKIKGPIQIAEYRDIFKRDYE